METDIKASEETKAQLPLTTQYISIIFNDSSKT